MKFLIDGSKERCAERWRQWPDGVGGQLLTPLTAYRNCSRVFGIDNGAYSGFDEQKFVKLLKRESHCKHECLFVCIPDQVGSHVETLNMWERYKHLADGWKRAFVAQDGFGGLPSDADALFLGGTTQFKDSKEADEIVLYALSIGIHVHIGRVNQHKRFWHFHDLGAHTCDGSGVSRFGEKIDMIRNKRHAL
jgi:hypothetical protein